MYIYTYYIYIHTCFFSTPGIQKWWKLTSFGVDIFFCQLLESKKWGKLTSFGVDMFFPQLLDSKNWQNWLVLVLTEWNLEPLPSKYSKIMYYTYVHIYILYIYTYMFFSTPGIQKCWKLTSFGVDMFFLNSWTPKNWQNWLVLVLTEWNLEPLPSKYSKIM